MGNGVAPLESDEGADERSLIDDVRTLLEDGSIAIEAELNYQKSRIAYCGRAGRSMAIFIVAALFFALFTLVALTVGVLLALVPTVSAWGAAAIVTGAFLLAMLFCVWRVWRAWRKIRSAFTRPDA